MSRIGQRPIPLPEGVEGEVRDGEVEVRGPKGKLRREFALPEVKVEVGDRKVVVRRLSDSDKARAAHGLVRMLIANMVHGVSQGYREILLLVGVGYRVQLQGNVLHLTVGYSQPLRVVPPQGIHVEVEGANRIILTGADKEQLGAFVAHLKSLRPMSRYGYKQERGKGIKKESEEVRFKQRRQTTG